MRKLQETLDALQPYVIGIRYVDGFPVVDAVFKEGWTLSESDLVEKVKGNDELNYHMIFSKKDGIGLDELLEYIDTVIKANIEREKKHELLKEKVNELKEVFKKTSLLKLKKLKYCFSDEELIPDINEFNLNDMEIEPTKPLLDITTFVNPSFSIELETSNEAILHENVLSEEEAEFIAEEARAENYRKINEINKSNKQHKKISTKVELPPKRTIQNAVSGDESPECDCEENEACNKCIGYKDL